MAIGIRLQPLGFMQRLQLLQAVAESLYLECHTLIAAMGEAVRIVAFILGLRGPQDEAGHLLNNVIGQCLAGVDGEGA